MLLPTHKVHWGPSFIGEVSDKREKFCTCHDKGRVVWDYDEYDNMWFDYEEYPSVNDQSWRVDSTSGEISNESIGLPEGRE